MFATLLARQGIVEASEVANLLGIYAVARDAGSVDFPSRYREFLLATGNRSTEDTVKDSFGYDLREPDFWNRSLDVVADRVRRFVDLASSND